MIVIIGSSGDDKRSRCSQLCVKVLNEARIVLKEFIRYNVLSAREKGL